MGPLYLVYTATGYFLGGYDCDEAAFKRARSFGWRHPLEVASIFCMSDAWPVLVRQYRNQCIFKTARAAGA